MRVCAALARASRSHTEPSYYVAARACARTLRLGAVDAAAAALDSLRAVGQARCLRIKIHLRRACAGGTLGARSLGVRVLKDILNCVLAAKNLLGVRVGDLDGKLLLERETRH